jgi:glucokinase
MNQSYTTTITVDQTPEEVFNAIKNIRAWWSGKIGGSSDKLGDEFTYQYKDMHSSTQKVTEFIPGKKIVWHVTDATISFTQKKDEWKDTDIVFEISEKEGKTELHFTHVGLVPEFECYEACSSGWGGLINDNLRQLIISGEEQPDVFADIVK